MWVKKPVRFKQLAGHQPDYYLNDGTPSQTGISDSDIELTLEKILNSHAFSRSKRSAAFLRYVVEEKLAGRAERLGGLLGMTQ